MDNLESIASSLPVSLIIVLGVIFFILTYANKKLKEYNGTSSETAALNKIIDILTLALKKKTIDGIKDPEKKKEAEKMWDSMNEKQEEPKQEEVKKES